LAAAEAMAWPADTPQGESYTWWVRHVIELRHVRPDAPLRSLRRKQPATPAPAEASQPMQLTMELQQAQPNFLHLLDEVAA
jgi:hypothetical protein